MRFSKYEETSLSRVLQLFVVRCETCPPPLFEFYFGMCGFERECDELGTSLSTLCERSRTRNVFSLELLLCLRTRCRTVGCPSSVRLTECEEID